MRLALIRIVLPLRRGYKSDEEYKTSNDTVPLLFSVRKKGPRSQHLAKKKNVETLLFFTRNSSQTLPLAEKSFGKASSGMIFSRAARASLACASRMREKEGDRERKPFFLRTPRWFTSDDVSSRRESARRKTPWHTTHNATPRPRELTEDYSGRTTHEGSPLPASFSSFSSPLAS